MAKKKPSSSDLGRRERQIMDAIHQLGEASVSDVRSQIPDPPGYSSVRTMVRLLESKGLLTHRQSGKRYVYRATQSREQASKSALQHLLATFFKGSATDAVAAILDAESVGADELKRIESIVRKARKEGK
ncbi:BlaI/MecI/CopY family transcriptional regulator [Aeoliella sp.]|uniref:BlaI/MecI/CopY family transcriptional regulator n=1 Tax=Aeoliella sp. TaxID=2795800 RepID=UPI003CCBEBD0